MRSRAYGDVLSAPRKPAGGHIQQVPAEPGLVVEEPASEFCGAVVASESGAVTLEDRHGVRRVFPLRRGAFHLDGKPVTLVAPTTGPARAPAVSASGSVQVERLRARTARDSRIWVEGKHDAELIERVWGHDLRVEGVVVERLDGVDELAAMIAAFGTGPERRLGVLVDHLVHGSKESRLVAGIEDDYVLVTGHPYVDVWQAVRPGSLGIDAWPSVPTSVPWKEGVCQALGWSDPAEGWRRVLTGVRTFRDLETPLVTAVEQLIDFVAPPAD